jgi:hypothetical protein
VPRSSVVSSRSLYVSCFSISIAPNAPRTARKTTMRIETKRFYPFVVVPFVVVVVVVVVISVIVVEEYTGTGTVRSFVRR